MNEPILLKSLPLISFAHIFNTEKGYKNYLPKRYDSFEFGYIKSSDFIWQINNQKYSLPSGSIFFLPHDMDIITCCENGTEHHCIGFMCPFEINFPQKPFITIEPSHPGSPSIKEKIDQLIFLYNTNKNKQQKIFSLIFEIVDKINDVVYVDSALEHPQFSESFYIKKIKDYVKNHISSKISLTDIASPLHISVPYMCFVFKKNLGTTIIHYINTQKVKKIKTLIIHYGFSLKEASSLVGIDDPTYASRLFKKYEHISIREYIKNLRNEI